VQKLKKLIIRNSLKLFILFFISTFYIKVLNAIDLQGSFIQGGIAYGMVEVNTKVFFDKKKVPLYKDGSFIIGFHRKHKAKSILQLVYNNGETFEKIIKIKKRDYNIQKINNLDKRKVIPPESYYLRIKEEARLVKKAKNIYNDFPFYKQGFVVPAVGVITGVYGSQRVLNGIPKRPHYGIDIANKKGTNILAPSDGIVVLAENDLYFSGGTLIISHGMGLTSSLLHLSEIFFKVGDKVYKGDKIGLMGSTGRSTGPHVDWRMELRGVRIDPDIVLSILVKN